MNLLRTENLCKTFGKLIITRDVNLSVSQGERHVVIGPNGAGKTSLIHQITGQIKPSYGRIFFSDHDITGMRPELICQLGLGRRSEEHTSDLQSIMRT